MKVLIIKTGHTETFDLEALDQDIVSLGDVLRSTVLLHLFKEDQVNWLTSLEALPLLKDNSLLYRCTDSLEKIADTHYDLIINLERTKQVLQLLPNLKAQKVLGFTVENSIIYIQTASGSELFPVWLKKMSEDSCSWSDKLYRILGEKWNSEKYFFTSTSINKSSNDRIKIGLNWKVGKKWPGKSWPFEKWESLSTMLSSDFEISWQEGFNDLNLYSNWIKSCDFIVTHDSLGLHLSLALHKPLLALFGPTSSHEIELYGLGEALSTQDLTIQEVANAINKMTKR